ncbi:MAG: dihydrodipicolinate synthase family protein [Myxococcota bacterium]|nr:dihydrodipicolinate synthase family protein [Myxococcota bacterium]
MTGSGTDLDALVRRIRPRRRIRGMAAVLLPFEADGRVDWTAFAAHVERTAACGLAPAVNMDTGYVQLLDGVTRERVLDHARLHADGDFVAGAFVADAEGARFDAAAYRTEMARVRERGGTPVVFPSHGLSALPGKEWAAAHAELAEGIDRFLAFELGPMFVPYGRIASLGTWEELLAIPQCLGAKHSSLSRRLEWERLALRDALRPDFLVLTGNDLAIDMVMYGSDYLLGLATFAPERFAARDACWEAGDPDFFAHNDALQALGSFAFREPVPAYRHDAAIFLHLRGQAASDAPHPRAPRRPAGERAVLAELGRRLGVLAS